MVMVLRALAYAAGACVGERGAQNALPIDAVMLEEPVVLGGEKSLDELRRKIWS